MVSPWIIGNAVKSGISTVIKYKDKLRQDPFTPEINRLKKERGKWTSAIDLIGRENPPVGATCYEVEENVINNLSAIERVALPYTRGNLLIPSRVYFYTDPKTIREIREEVGEEESLLFKKIYPNPEKAISSIEKDIEAYLSGTDESGCIENFEEKRSEIIKALYSSMKRIKAPYKPGFDYSEIKNELFETVKRMKGIEYDYFLNIQQLSRERNLRRAKIGVAATVTFAVGIVIGSKLKKAKALNSIL